MAGLLQQYGLGTKGVNRVANPIRMREGELRLAQNAALSTIRGRAALGKRKGWALVIDTTTDGASGGVLSVISVLMTDSDP
jgi:hypothetical protein